MRRSRPIAAALLLITALSSRAAADERPAILQRTGIDQRLDEQVPLDLRFRDETGAAVQLKEYFDQRPVLLNLVYYECPMLCGLVLNGTVSALRAMSLNVGEDFDVVTVSFDARETHELAAAKKASILEQYRRPSAAAGWHFLTGDSDQIKALADSVGFRFEWDEQTKQFAHAAGIVVLTPQGRVSRYFYGVEFPPRDLRLGLVEASQNRIGNLVDAVLLYCFHWDPLTGRYSQLTLNAIRIAGALTVLALGGLILFLLRRERGERHGPAAPLTPKRAAQH